MGSPLAVRVTPGVQTLLDDVASCSGVAEALREDANTLRGEATIPWDQLKSIVHAYREANPGKCVYLHQLCTLGDAVLTAPQRREKSPELQARLNRLTEELENKRYAAMVADVTARERKADEMRSSLLPTSRLQLSFGAHVLVTMFTFWAVAFYGTKWYFRWDDVWAGLSGALGLTCGLLVETLLLVVRSNRPEPLEERMPELFDEAKVKAAFAAAKERKAAAKQKQKQKGKQPGGQQGRGGAAGTGQAGAAAATPGEGPEESKKAR